MKYRFTEFLFVVLLLILLNVYMTRNIYQSNSAGRLSEVDFQGDDFRRQQLSERILPYLAVLQQNSSIPLGELLTVMQARGGTDHISAIRGHDPEYFAKWRQILLKYNPVGFERVSEAYNAIWNDIACFPVAESNIAYENSWMFERTYGGKRGHEGTDLIPPENLSGFYKIISMTDGVVEKIGWLPQGGYRIGIRSPSGGYYYYAHLENYSTEFAIGDIIEAGDVLGTMGDTGYGEEGTRGQFPVHLHLGIYIATEEVAEIAVNPYWVLRYLQYRLG